MNAIMQSTKPHNLMPGVDMLHLERVLQQLADSIRGGTTRPYASLSSGSGQGPLQTGVDAEELVQVELGGRVYSLMCWFPSHISSAESSCLSPREREVVRLVANGLPNKTIARALDISAWTVATYMRRIFTKLGVSSRAEMVARALKEGLLAEATGV